MEEGKEGKCSQANVPYMHKLPKKGFFVVVGRFEYSQKNILKQNTI